jgi:hypothetical protein
MSNVFRGTSAPQLQSQSFDYDFQRGGKYQQIYKGSSQAQMASLWNANVYKAARASMKFVNDTAEMTIEWGGSSNGSHYGNTISTAAVELTIDKWEMPEPRFSKDLMTHPLFIYWITSLFNGGLGITEAQLSDIIAILRTSATQAITSASASSSEQQFIDLITGYCAGCTPSIAAPAGVALGAQNIFMRFYRFMANDQTHYQSSQFSLRHTTNIPAYWSGSLVDDNVNCIYPYCFFHAETISSNWNYQLPQRLQNAFSVAYANFVSEAAAKPGFQIGFLKSAGSQANVGRDRIEVQNDYVLDQWSTDIYPVATSV